MRHVLMLVTQVQEGKASHAYVKTLFTLCLLTFHSLNWVMWLSPNSTDGEVHSNRHEGRQWIFLNNLPQMNSFSSFYWPFRNLIFLRTTLPYILLIMFTVSATLITSLGRGFDCLCIFKARHYQVIVENCSYRKSSNEKTLWIPLMKKMSFTL